MKTFDVYSVFGIDLKRASGSRVWDVNGKEYLDLYGGHAVISIGHSHPRFTEAICKQLQDIAFYSNSVEMPLQAQLAKKLGDMSDCGDYRLFLCNSGAEANENALKLASFHTGRKKVIAFSGAFHGRTSLAVALTDNAAISAPINATENCITVPLNDRQAFDAVMDEGIAAVIVEGIQGVAGIVEPEADFLRHISERCDACGACLILDEVQSGYGRTGRFFAHQHSGIRPHLISIAKGMGNGFPIGGVLIHPMFEEKKERLGTTFGGSYLACAAGLAVLDVIQDEQLMQHAEAAGDFLKSELQGLSGLNSLRGKGLMLGLGFDFPVAELRKALLYEHGIFTGSASRADTLRILPALSVSQDQLGYFLNALRQLLNRKKI